MMFFLTPFHTNTLTFLFLCNRRLNFFTGSLLRRCMTVAVTQFDCNFCHKYIAHDEISVPLPVFPLQQHFSYEQLTPHLLHQHN